MAVMFFNPERIVFGFVLCALAVSAALMLRRRSGRGITVRAANTHRLRALPVYRRKRLESAVYRSTLTAGLAVSLVCALFLTARPFRKDVVTEDVTRSDIFLCMDISASSCPGLAGFVEEFEKLIPELNGDQVGISLFNTSGMQYVPVTEDDRFLTQRLDELAEYFRAAAEFQSDYADRYDYVHEIPGDRLARYEELNAALAAFDRGTTAGYEVKGTSVVGEGLAACLFSFPELHTQPRSRIILFVTDNIPEILGDPLVTLEEAAEMCASDAVKVYGIYPDVGSAGEDGTDQARSTMKAAVESTGGAFFEMRGGMDAGQILAVIRDQMRAESETAAATKDMDAPETWIRILMIGMGLTLAALVYPLAKTRWRIFGAWPVRRKLTAAAVLLAAVTCAVLTAVRPMRIDRDQEIRTTNLDVCFAVDTTISMWAEDYAGAEKRISGVRKDIVRIMEALPGSSFSLVRFDNGAQILAPYTRSTAVLEDCIDGIGIPSWATAEGSTLNTVHDTLAAMIRASEEKNGVRKTVVFLLSDGEITDGSALMRFDDLKDGVDDGAVLGYGTAAGGRMLYPGKGYIRDSVRDTDARSVIDEENLKSVAKDLEIKYIHSGDTDSGNLTQTLNGIRRMSRNAALQAGDRTGWKETYYFFSGILALILTGCLFRLLRRGSLL